jgi:hypothetical protein
MPNWCNNTLQFESRKPIRDFLMPYLNEMEDGGYEFDFNKIIPVPEDLNITCQPSTKDEELQKKYDANQLKHGFRTWYEFSVAKWGTKWCGSGDFNHDDTAFVFDTAWSPSTPITEKLAKKLEGDEMLIHNYIEIGMEFCGKFVAGNLGGVDEYYNKIKDAPQALLDELGWEPWEDEEIDEDEEMEEDEKP